MALKQITEHRVDSEDEVRLAVAKYFMELGFTEDELSLEDHFSIRLGHNATRVDCKDHKGRLSGFSDILITRNGKNLAIVETKGPDHTLTEQDKQQAISYARLLEQMAPFAIVTNGNEIKAYDVIDLTEIETPAASVWYKNGQTYTSFGQQDRDDAARKLFRFSPEFVKSFFAAQMKTGMSELKGSVASHRSYTPELYVTRSHIEDHFALWIESNVPVFAIVGDSGTGKTNSMCNLAEALSQQHLVLFYQALRLRENLVASVQDDLAWEFGTNRHISFFIDRFVDLASATYSKIIIFVDGLDEFPGDKHHLLNDLIAFIQRLQDLPIRLCVSCKSFDWDGFVIRPDGPFNQLALNTFPKRPSVHHPQPNNRPNAQDIGLHLDDFTQEEKENAFVKYREAFDLAGELEGDLYKECAFPLMLRFVAQAYRGSELRLSQSFSNIEIFQKYLDNRLGQIHRTRQSLAKRILNKIASMSIKKGHRLVDVDALDKEMRWTDYARDTFYELSRLNFLRLAEDGGREKVTFSFERIRAYIYTTVVNQWHASDAPVTLAEIQRMSKNHLGLETIEFYFTHIDRGQTELLTEIAIANFDLFAVLTTNLEFRSSINDIAPENQAAAYHKRLEQFTIAHSRIKHTHFPVLRKRLRPYSENDTGVWVTPSVSMFQLRACTDILPQQVVVVSEELAANTHFGNHPNEGFRRNLAGVGPVHLFTNDLFDLLPQKFAWDVILEDLNHLFEQNDLYDGTNPEMLQEEIWDVLLYPKLWSPKPYFQVLGYSDPDDVKDTAIADLLDRIHKYLSDKSNEIDDESLSPQKRRPVILSCQDMLKMHELLTSLSNLTPTLKPPSFRRRTLFETIRDKSNLAAAQQVVSELVDLVLVEYRPMLDANFPGFANKFRFCGAVTDQPLLVEAAISPDDDRTAINYAILPTTVNLPSNLMIVIGHSDWILQKVPLHSINGNSIKYRRGFGGADFGISDLDVTIDGVRIVEPRTVVYRTTLSLDLPIRSQVHQLIGVEANTIFGADWHAFS